jgi:hypothetical protein
LYSGSCYSKTSTCSKYGPGLMCIECPINYKLIEGICLQSNMTSCGAGEGLSQGVCLLIQVNNCQNVSNGICLCCSSGIFYFYLGYSLINGLCFQLGSVPNSACLQYDINNHCLQCSQQYYLNGTACVNPIL